jgi:hypothetical protein
MAIDRAVFGRPYQARGRGCGRRRSPGAACTDARAQTTLRSLGYERYKLQVGISKRDISRSPRSLSAGLPPVHSGENRSTLAHSRVVGEVANEVEATRFRALDICGRGFRAFLTNGITPKSCWLG